MTQSFECPSCSAPLDYDGSGALVVHCPYCSTSVIVPEELRRGKPAPEPLPTFAALSEQSAKLKELAQLVRANQKIEAIKLYREMFGVGLQEAKYAIDRLSEGQSVQVANMTIELDGSVGSVPPSFQAMPLRPVRATGRRVGCIGLVFTLGLTSVIFLVIGVIVLLTVGNPLATVLNGLVPSSFAYVELTFGGEGTGPGLFTDARHVAVDGEGTIYVGEHTGGRIQVFNADGEFVSLWMIDGDTPLVGLAADRQGTVYVVQGGHISRYEGATGNALGQLEYAEGRGFDDIAVAADGGLVTSWNRADDDIVRFDAQGNAVLTIRAAISEQSGDSELDTHVAVDGLGNIYALGTFNRAVFKFTPDGKFVTRFGGDGDEAGQFRAPHAIAVDGQGRVYVSDFKGIQVFDSDGRYLDLIDVDGPAFGMAFNDKNELFVAARNKVLKYVLQTP